MIGTIQALQNAPLSFRLYGPIFWLRAVHPYGIRPFKSQRPERKLTFDHRTTQLPLPLSWNNDRKIWGPTEPLCHFWVIWSHLLAQNPLSIWSTAKLSFEPLWRSWSITTVPPTTPLESAKFWIFSNVGQTPLGRPLMVLLDWKVVSNASVGCLGVPGVDFGWFEPTSLWPPNHPTPKPNFYFCLI